MKKILKLSKALDKLGIKNEVGEFTDKSASWLEIEQVRDDTKYSIVIDNHGDVHVYKTERKWEEDEKRIF